MRPQDLRQRTKVFALQVVDLCDRLPSNPKFQEVGSQLRKAANAVASNYRAAGRARSHADFVSKIGIVLEEADESQHWLEMLSEMGFTDDAMPALRRESAELVAIFTASQKTASRRQSKHLRAQRP